ncbi:MAG: hypothetical protein M8840_11575, partial [marine benthic group bacterium]|nr:hypothetical protein [Gemmatimonadota bacterium]
MSSEWGVRRRLVPGAIAVAVLVTVPHPAPAQHLLVPMDGAQSDHLRAYGLVYETISRGASAEWLLNFRDGSFLLPAQRRV